VNTARLLSGAIVGYFCFQFAELCLFLDYGQAEIDAANLPIGPMFTTQPVSTIYDVRSTIKVASFMCEADARPLPSYVWFLTHHQVRGEVDLTDQGKTVTNGRLTIAEPSETEDNGDYQCIAKNSFGAILSDFATLSFGCKIIYYFQTCMTCLIVCTFMRSV